MMLPQLSSASDSTKMLRQGLVLLAVSLYVVGLELSADFVRCKRSDPKLDDCLKVAIEDALQKMKKGLPEFKISAIQPIQVPSLTVGEGKGPVSVVQKFTEVKIYDLVRAKVVQLDSSLEDTKMAIQMEVLIDKLRVIGNYDFNGRILLLPFVGKGKAHITFRDLKASLNIKGKTIERDGDTYMELTDLGIQMYPGKIEFQFSNLFNGDEVLGAETNKLLNENWKEIWEDVRSGYETWFSIVLRDIANKIFINVPYGHLI